MASVEVITVGTGNCRQGPMRGMSCSTFRFNGDFFVIDIGSGAIQSIMQIGVPPVKISRIVLTHFHMDHILDLFHLIWLRHCNKKEVRDVLEVFAPRGLKRLLSTLQSVFGDSVSTQQNMVIVNEIGVGESVKRGEVCFRFFKTTHTVESVGVTFVAGGRTVSFTGDCGLDGSLVDGCCGADLCVSECSFPGSSPVPTHMGAVECGLLAKRSSVKHLVLTHIPHPVDVDLIEKNIRKNYDGTITVASDFSKFVIG